MKRAVLAAIMVLAPCVAHAQVAQFTFTTAPQTVAPNASTEQITLEAQDASGAAVSGSTLCIKLSTSGTGTFSSNSSWSDPLATLSLTLSSNQSRRNFYYKGSVSGTHALTAQAAPRPDGSTCSQWTPEAGATWTATHAVTIAGTSAADGAGASSATSTADASQAAPTQVSAQSTPVSSYVPPPEPTLFTDGGGDRIVIVGADTVFIARAYNRNKETVDNATFKWNFGDGATALGSSVLHHYTYPGRYVVVLSVAKNFESVSDRFVVVAEPARIGFFIESDGSIIIENNAGRDLDLSAWVVRALFREFLLPEDSVVLSGASMRISPKTLGFFAGAETELAYPNGGLALKATQASAPGPQTVAASAAPAAERAPARVRASTAEATAREEPKSHEASVDEATSSEVAIQVAAASAARRGSPWWLGALALAVLTGAGVVATRRFREKEWDIIEEST